MSTILFTFRWEIITIGKRSWDVLKTCFLENSKQVDKGWTKNAPPFFVDVFQVYNEYLKASIQDAIPFGGNISKIKEE